MRSRTAYLGVVGLLSLGIGLGFGLRSGLGQAQPPEAKPADPVTVGEQEVVIELSPDPSNPQTAWKLRWDHGYGKGLFLTEAWFRKGPNEPWLKILNDARLSDIFVPYGPGSPRYWDLSMGFGLAELTDDDPGPNGRLLEDIEGRKVVALEMRDRGILWKDYYGVRRGREAVLWGAVQAGNYYYLTQYGFCDEGTITFRIGATGRNLPGMETVTHMHSGLWRVDLALVHNENDPIINNVMVMRRKEPSPYVASPSERSMGTSPAGLQSRVDSDMFNNEIEGGLRWEPEEFPMIRIESARLKNAKGKPLAYDTVTPRVGSARHFGEDEMSMQYDFYITRFAEDETAFRELPQYIKQRRSIANTRVVLWYISPTQHEVRSEDGQYVEDETFPFPRWVGSTHVMWTGFDLKPRNLFDSSPFYQETPPNPRRGVTVGSSTDGRNPSTEAAR